MPRLYPAEPGFPDDGGAERTVWEALRDQLPDDAVLFSGVALQHDATECEIDLLIAWPGVGLAAIEVKGGHVRRADGAWWQGSGDAARRIDPVDQVQHARHVLHDLLRERGLDAAWARAAHVVVLPHSFVPRDWSAPELPRTALVDRADLAGVAGIVKAAIDRHGAGHQVLDVDATEGLVQYLAGGFPSQVEVLASAALYEDHLDQLTRDQVHVLDLVADWPRLQVVGGAGTGKTWLALEQTRRRARAGDRVALLCYSRGLGRYLQRVTAAWPARDRPAYVGLFHDLALEWGAAPGDDNDSAYWEDRLPSALAEVASARPAADLFDSVVVDEAQDFNASWWPPLLSCLRDPDRGRLTVFSDEGQRVFPRVGQAPVDMAPIRLSENLRSTKQIAQLCGSLHDGVTRPRGWPGEAVRLVDVPADEALHAADDAVDGLLAEGWSPGSIALLTTHHRHPLQVEAVGAGGHAAYWDAFLAGDDVFYGHVLGFKGLERAAVVLTVDGFRDLANARTMLYAGLSRARLLLVVVGPRGLVEGLGGEAGRRRLADAVAWDPRGA